MQITRLELYELVSKSPLSKVAPSLAISATTLAEICRKHNVPYPGSGYWTRKSLGQTVMLDPLPLDSEEEPIDIEPAKPRVLRAEGRTTAAIAETAKSTEQIAPAIAVPITKERPTKPHPLIAKWIADRERRRREATESRDLWRIKMAPALSDIDRRRHAILDALFQSLEGKGAK
jgi:hypothetical protein